ncbi:hypothetical protein [Oceanicoccus sagamiensis]|uniref:Delta-aminolevulinic acid dehydratase n=1 Tax=Oceanicoccus sagamiensis TaxID=716816 RepID=A0A1X9N8H6_9GAMM|nr:hypothetical protein [Oceanicoccus sagamiensis]ARN73471.1 hypothetical protein BST96_04680 [Oceanicoccus sagamiensis]
MPYRLKPLLLLTLLFSQQALSCECLWQGSFSKAYKKADLIVSGSIIASKGNSADFYIDRTHLDRGIGFTEFNSTIRVWGDNGQLCRPKIKDFPVGTQWVLSLNKITGDIPSDGFNPDTPNISYGRVNDYYLSKCGANWLKLEEGLVTGNLVKGRRWEWENKTMNPVLLALIDAYIKEIIPEEALVEAAKPLTETKKLMEETKRFLREQ